MNREAFERTNPVPKDVKFNVKLGDYCWKNYSNNTAPFNDLWEAFCDGWEAAIGQQVQPVATVDRGVLNWLADCQFEGPADLVVAPTAAQEAT